MNAHGQPPVLTLPRRPSSNVQTLQRWDDVGTQVQEERSNGSSLPLHPPPSAVPYDTSTLRLEAFLGVGGMTVGVDKHSVKVLYPRQPDRYTLLTFCANITPLFIEYRDAPKWITDRELSVSGRFSDLLRLTSTLMRQAQQDATCRRALFD
jgi:hypothetical protein